MTSNTYHVSDKSTLSTEVNRSVDIKEHLKKIMDDTLPTLPGFNKPVNIEVPGIFPKLNGSPIKKGPISDSEI